MKTSNRWKASASCPHSSAGTCCAPPPLAWEHHGNSALRDGKWKIVTEFRANQPTKCELYDMDADRTELHDLAATQPEKLKELAAKWQAWADRVGVQPWPLKRLAR